MTQEIKVWAEAAARSLPWGEAPVVGMTGLEAITEVLAWAYDRGMLRLPQAVTTPTTAEAEVMARDLAAASQSPRYTTTPGGWRQLLTEPGLLEHALAAANARSYTRQARDTVAALYDGLRRYHAAGTP